MTSKPLQGFGARSIFIILAIVLIMTLFTATASSAPGYIAGDVNSDGVIDVRDVVIVMKHILGLQFPPLTEDKLTAADINGDGVVNVTDAVEIMKISLGLRDSYPMPITSLDDAVVRVPIGTALADINLPKTVQANFAGGQKRNISVRWEQVSKPAYNPFVFDEYIFRGELINLPSGVRNPAGLLPRARVSFLLRDPWPFPGPEPDPPYTLTLQPNPLQGGMVFGSGNYRAGAQIEVCTVANPGYTFVNWTRAGTEVSSNRCFFFTMPAANTTLRANFNFVGSQYEVTFAEQNYEQGVSIQVYANAARTVPVGLPVATNASGQALKVLQNGTYFFKASKTGFQDNLGSFTVAGAGKTVPFTMSTMVTWPIYLDGLPLIVHDPPLFDVYEVTVTIKSAYRNQVTAVTVLGREANQLPIPDDNKWRVIFDDEVTLDDLRGRIEITLDNTATVDAVDISQSKARIFDLGDTYVYVYLKQGQSALSVNAGGYALTYNIGAGRWESGAIYNYATGDTINVTVLTSGGTQSVDLTIGGV